VYIWIHPVVLVQVHVYAHSHIHAHAHTHIHIYTHAYTQVEELRKEVETMNAHNTTMAKALKSMREQPANTAKIGT
jgi:hypothetical protein